MPKIEYVREGPVAHLRLNRPDKLNALDPDCLDLLEAHITEANRDPEVRAVVLSGRGRCFCAGADLAVVQETAGDKAAFDAFLRHWHRAFGAVDASGKPTIAAVHGVALAGGFELTQVCDMLVLGASARLGDQHAKLGLFPGGGSTQRLPRMIAPRHASWLLLSGEQVDSTTALSLGLANRVVADDQVVDEAHAMALVLAERSTAASARIKSAIRQGAGLELTAALDVERAIAVEHMASADARIGLEAFAARTQPDFGFRGSR